MKLLNSFLLFLALCYVGAEETSNLRGNALADKSNDIRVNPSGPSDTVVTPQNDRPFKRRTARKFNPFWSSASDCLMSGCSDEKKMYNDKCDDDCNTVECNWDGLACPRDESFRLTLGTSNVHRYAYSGMNVKFTVYATSYATSGVKFSFNINTYGVLPGPGDWPESYRIKLPDHFGAIDEDKIKIEATNDDGWCVDLVKINSSEMNLKAECEGGYCDREALWLDQLSRRESDTSYAFIGNYGKADSWTLSSYQRPRKND